MQLIFMQSAWPQKEVMVLKIKQIGLLANFVDSGRKTKQSEGYSQSGPIDSVHFALANALLGLPLESPALEVLGGRFSCTFENACLICVSGAKAELKLNNVIVNNNMVLQVEAGDELSIGELDAGLSHYIGFAARFDIPLFADSVCAVAREGSGGLRGDGSPLRAGDGIGYTALKTRYPDSQNLKHVLNQHNADIDISTNLQAFESYTLLTHKSIRMNLSYQASLFSEQQLAQFCLNTYKISAQSDRMGMRLKGDSILCEKKVLSSQAIVLGAVQIPGDGQAIIMRQDRQTIGGYPIIGVVDVLSLAILGQANPGDTLQFSLSDFEHSRQQTLLVVNELTQLAHKRAKTFFA